MILDLFRLDGKTAVVTGARKGLGFGLAEALAEAGADIVGVGREDMPELAARLKELGRRFLYVKADLSRQDKIQEIVDKAVGAFGKIDILVNDAGFNRRKDFLEFSEQDWDDVLNIHLKTPFMLGQAVARQMAAQGNGGKIINIASMTSFQTSMRVVAYTTSKSGIAGLTRQMGLELAPHRINVNAIAPGWFATDMTQAVRENPELGPAISARIPMGRWGTPSDLKGAAVFLASAASDYMTGQVVAVDGGWLSK